MGKGCKIVMIVGIILLAILVGGLVLSYFYCSEIMTSLIKKSVDSLETEVLNNLPEGFTVDDVKARFAEFKDVVLKQTQAGKITPEVQAWAQDVQKALADKKISKEELEQLFDQMKKIVSQASSSGS